MNPVFTIFQGNAKTLYLKAVSAACLMSGPLDLTDCTEIEVSLPNADGTMTTLKLSEDDVTITAPALLGKFRAPISAEVSTDLNPGSLQDFDVTFTVAGEKFTVRYFRALSVFEVR